MSDSTKEPIGSAPKSPSAGHQPLPKSTQLTFTQHVFIWLLIIVVGVLFGMGGSMGTLMTPDADHHGVSPREIQLRRDVDTRLTKALDHSQQPQSDDQYSQFIKLVWAAQKAGLEPAGKALDQLVEDFLDHDLGKGRTIRSALIDAQGTENEVSRTEVKRLIAEEAAAQAFQFRHNATPAVPLGAGVGLTMVDGDKVAVQSAVLDASSLLQPVKPDDPEIQTTYETMRAQGKFIRQPTETVTIAYADMPALTTAARATITAAQIQAYYDAHKAEPRFSQPLPPPPPKPVAKPGVAPPPAPPAPVAQPKPLVQVRPEIIQALADEQALAQAKAMTKALDANAEDLEGQKDSSGFSEEAKKIGLAVKTGLVIEQPVRNVMMERYLGPQPLSIDLGPTLGELKDEAGLFNADKEPGFISRPLTSSLRGTEIPLMLRLESRTEAGFKPLAEVKAEVIRRLQGNRAYAPFMAALAKARDAAQKLGANGLATYLASPAAAAWHARVAPETIPASEMLTPPPASLGLTAPDGHVAASLALGDHPVLIVEEDAGDDDIPHAKLLQATGYTPAPAVTELAERVKLASQYRSAIEGYTNALFEPELKKITQ